MQDQAMILNINILIMNFKKEGKKDNGKRFIN